MKLRTIVNFLSINWWQTLRFNLHYLPFSQAIKFPILVSYRTKVANLGGRLEFNGVPTRFGLLKIGFKSIGFQDGYYDRTVWQINGDIILHGSANIGRGSKLSVSGGGVI